jgi:prevent-host-death family protein
MQVDVEEAKAILPTLIERACSGEEIIITRDSQPSVKLVPVQLTRRRVFGSMKGKFTVSGESDPLPADELDAWEQ